MKHNLIALAAIISTIYLSPTFAVEEESVDKKVEENRSVEDKKNDNKLEQPTFIETKHQFELGKIKFEYSATVGKLPIINREGETQAEMFFVSYRKQSTSPENPRPICFIFNGGPGSSSIWLHFGLIGPYRVPLSSEGTNDLAPSQLIKNEYTLLTEADLVFIDPVCTGFSRPDKPEKAKDFMGVDADAKSIAQFIESYLTHFNAWLSPKYLIGESYGTLRAVAVSSALEENNIYIQGLGLISSYLSPGVTQTDLDCSLTFPSYTATAWSHKKLSPELQKDFDLAIAKSKEFARKEYLTALFQGKKLSKEDKEDIAQKIAYYTGLEKEYILKSNLRIDIDKFSSRLLDKEGLRVGLYDGQQVAPVYDRSEPLIRGPLGNPYVGIQEPSIRSISGHYLNACQDYLKTKLNYSQKLPYRIFGSTEYESEFMNWDRRGDEMILAMLQVLIQQQPQFKVLVANGYYDLVTPFFTNEYLIDQLLFDNQNQRVKVVNYPGGHMMYTNKDGLTQLSTDLRDLVRIKK